jgi:hypothetical protein
MKRIEANPGFLASYWTFPQKNRYGTMHPFGVKTSRSLCEKIKRNNSTVPETKKANIFV